MLSKRASLQAVLLALLLACSFFASAANLPDFTQLVESAAPAVVNISTTQTVQKRSSRIPQEVPEIFRHFFGELPEGFEQEPSQQQRQSLGSGFIISDDGYILTNNHVIENADEIVVRLSDRRELIAELIGSDASSDLALLKIDAKGLPVVTVGNSDKLKVGEWVLAIGSPFGFDHSVTAGIVSAKGRSLPNESYVPFIQTDVAINPGNSGGPLFNLQGEVVGINSQIFTRSGGFMGLSFAIPMEVAMDVVQQLKTSGKVERGWLGVVIQEVNKELAESFKLDKPSGALVAQVMADSPAAAGGLQVGDVIVASNGSPVAMSADLPHLIGAMKPGEVATLQIVRDGKRRTLKVKVGAAPEDEQLQLSGQPQTSKSNRLGLEVADLTEEQKKRLDVQKG